MRPLKSKRLLAILSALLIASCASVTDSGFQPGTPSKRWLLPKLTYALAASSRPQADRDRDADRKPALLMTFFGVEPEMTAVDLLAGSGYMTEVLSITVGPAGKVYSQNPAVNQPLSERLANNRLSNVVRVNGDLSSIAPNSIDVLMTVMNLHDVYNSAGRAMLDQALKDVYGVLKPGGIFGVVDHVGVPGADNAKLHRMTKEQAIEVVTAAGFVLDAYSDVLAHPADDHTKIAIDPSLRGKTDQFTLRFIKPK